MPSHSRTAPPRIQPRERKKETGRRPRLRTRATVAPIPITEPSEDIIGKTVWFFHPLRGVIHITVTGVFNAVGRHRVTKWGLDYIYHRPDGKDIKMTLWVKDYPLFETRIRCERWVEAMLAKSRADAELDGALGLL